MLKRATVALIYLIAAGCSQDRGSRHGASDAVMTSGGEAATAMTAIVARTRQQDGVAPFPDRGELVGYPSTPVTRRSGAFIWHQVQLSEARALQAVAEGTLSLAAPDGTPIRLRYLRHVEHPDGNWTWIGRNAAGDSAIITFGDAAVFGRIPVAGAAPLHLSTQEGHTWLVAADRGVLAADVLEPVSLDPDYVAAPDIAGTPLNVGTSPPAAVVDLALGYTAQYAIQYGGVSQAVTRLNYLVEVTNEAFANSRVRGRLRLVSTVMVQFLGWTRTNQGSLAELTAYGSTYPSLASVELHAARDWYGADLASLVRPWTPDQGRCGMAWLIGADQAELTPADAPFGFSMFSDGPVAVPPSGELYACPDTTLAHLLGHNLGQAHNREDTSVSGVSADAFGYRETALDGFHTIMARPLPGSRQVRIPYFANPNVSYQGRPTGTDGANNVASLDGAMVQVGGFRPARSLQVHSGRRVAGDLSGDGRADLLLRKGNQAWSWSLAGSTLYGAGSRMAAHPSYEAVLSGDLTGDGVSDIVFRTGTFLYLWIAPVNGEPRLAPIGGHLPDWELFAVGDADGDGKDDLWFRNGTLHAYWRMDGNHVTRGVVVGGAGGRYIPTQVADFTGDKRVEVLYEDSMTHNLWLWITQPDGSVRPVEIGTPGPGWELYTTADMNGDAKSDLLFRNGSQFAFWLMDGNRVTRGILSGDAGGSYRLAAALDTDGDGGAEVVFADTEGQLMHWDFAADFHERTAGLISRLPDGWSLVPAKH